MDEIWKEHLESAGVDVKGAIARFAGNEGLYSKFLIKFLQDATFSSLCTAMENRNPDEALRASHTLKGIAGNLGLVPLFDLCTEFVAALRADKAELCPAFYTKIRQSYGDITKVIKENEG